MWHSNNLLRSWGICCNLSEHSGEFHIFSLTVPNSPSQPLPLLRWQTLLIPHHVTFVLKHITQLPLALSLRTWRRSEDEHNGREARVRRVVVYLRERNSGLEWSKSNVLRLELLLMASAHTWQSVSCTPFPFYQGS